jgi:trimeric autotransporter adhesin
MVKSSFSYASLNDIARLSPCVDDPKGLMARWQEHELARPNPFREKLAANGLMTSVGCSEDVSNSTRRLVMQALRKACAVMGPGQKARIGRLGSGAAIGAVIASFATPAMAQSVSGGNNNGQPSSLAIGTGATTAVIAGSSVAVGNGAAVTTASEGVAVGANSSATGGRGVAVGTRAQVQNNRGIAIGTDAKSLNGAGNIGEAGNIAIGDSSVASANGTDPFNLSSAVSIGIASSATADGAVAYGEASASSAYYSSALGSYSVASAAGAVAVGGGSKATASGSIAIGGATSTGSVAGPSGFASSTGVNAIAIGNTASSSGLSAVALGRGTAAAGSAATAVGNAAASNSTNSTAIGNSARAGTAAGFTSGETAIGSASVADGIDATALGRGASAVIQGTTALGSGTNVTGQDSTAVGFQVAVSGVNSTGIGNQVTVSGAQSFGALSPGGASIVSGADSVVINPENAPRTYTASGVTAVGSGALASGNNATSIGRNANASGSTSFAGGSNTVASGPSSVALGNAATANKNYSIAIGESAVAGNTAGADNTTAIGRNASSTGLNGIALGLNSRQTNGGIAAGNDTASTGIVATSIGYRNLAAGNFSTAIGTSNTASGTSAIAIGNGSTANNTNSIAIGSGNIVSGANSGAVGDLNTVSGTGSYAFGNNNAIAADNAFAIGNNITIAAGRNGSVGIGDATTVAAPNTGAFTINGGTAAATAPTAVVSVGATGAERQVTNVAAGVVSATSSDAINGSQLFTTATAANNLGDTLKTLIGAGAVIAADGTLTTAPAIAAAGSTYGNVKAGVEALNTANTTTNNGLATALGGGAAVAANGAVTAPSYTVGGTTYNDVGSALAAAGSGFNLTTSASGTGSISGNTLEAIGAGETVTVTAGNNLIGTQTGNTVELSLNPALTGITSLAITGGPTLSGTGIYMGGDKITNLGAGATVSGSTDAVNGGQLNTGLGSVATNLGGGATYNPVTGMVTAPGYAVGGTTYNNVGAALSALQTGAPVQYSTVGSPTTPAGLTPTQNLTLVGAAAGPVTLDNVNAGSLASGSTQAVNGAQINTFGTSIATNTGGGSSFNPATGIVTAPTVNVGGTAYTNLTSAIEAAGAGFKLTTAASGTGTATGTTVEGIAAGETVTVTAGNNIAVTQTGNSVAVALNPVVTGLTSLAITGGPTISSTGITGLAAGAISVTSTDAVNGSQLFATNQAITNINNGTTGLVQQSPAAPSTGPITVGATTGGTVVNFANSSAVNRTLTGVAAGSTAATSVDAVNGGQLNTALASVATDLGGGASYNPVTGVVTAPGYAIDGTTYNNVGDALAALAADSKYVDFNSALAAANATGTNASAIGPNAQAAGNNSTALGVNSNAAGNNSLALGSAADASGTNATALGSLSSASGNNATALGNGAAATGTNSVALGSGSQADVNNAGWTGTTFAGQAMTNAVNANAVVSISGGSTNRQLTGVADGAVNATSTDAVNGAQLFTTATALDTKSTNIGAGLASSLGGGASVAPNGTVTNPTYSVAGSTQNSVGAALGALNAANNLANAGLASAIGGGASVAANGTFTAPTVNVNGTTYSNLTDAIQAAGGGFNLTTAATGTGVANGTSVSQIGAGETHTITAGNNIVTTQIGNEVQVALKNNLTGLVSIGITGGPTLDGTGITLAAGNKLDVAGNKITNVGAGLTSAGSTDAINGGQLNSGLASVAINFGGGSTYNPLTGTVTAPAYAIAGSTYNNVGEAFGGVNTALTNLSNGTAGLVQQVGGAPGTGQLTVGAATGGTSVSFVGTGGDRTLTGVKAGAVTATSTDAVTGAQIFTNNQSVANLLGGGAGVNPLTGALTAPSYLIAGSAYGDVGSALTALATGGARSKYFNANSSLADSTATGLNSVAIGPNAVATNAGDVALGNGAVTAAPHTGAFSLNGGTVAGRTPTSVVSIGAAGAERQVQNVGAGVVSATSTDAVNGSQLYTVANAGVNLARSMESITGGGLAINPDGTIATPARINVGGVAYNNVTAAIQAGDAKANTANAGLAAALGGGAIVAPDGTVTAPSYVVGGSTYNNVGGALGSVNAALTNLTNGTTGLVQQAGGAPGAGPITVGKDTGGTVVNMAGTDGNRTVTGVKAGALTASSTDAVNGSQVNALANSTATALGGGAAFDPATGKVSGPAYTVGGVTYNNVGNALAASNKLGVQYVPDTAGNATNVVKLSGNGNGQPVAVTNVAAGAVTATSTDAVNGGQLYAVQQTAAGAVQYDRNSDGSINSAVVSFGPPNASTPTVLRNVAAGVRPSDAVNLGQYNTGLAATLGSANAYTDTKINAISFDLGKVAQRAYAGTASAIALQAPAMFEPGQVSMRGGVGLYRGQWAMGLSVRATADNGRWSLSGGVSGGPRGGVAASAGIDFVLGE